MGFLVIPPRKSFVLGYVEHEKHGNFASRKFARSPPDERACYKLCLCISERRNRTRACFARRAAPTDNQNTPKAINDFRGILVTRTGDRNPRYARGKPHQEIQSEILTCGLQGSHTEMDNQKIPIVLNDYRDFLVTRTGIEPMFPA